VQTYEHWAGVSKYWAPFMSSRSCCPHPTQMHSHFKWLCTVSGGHSDAVSSRDMMACRSATLVWRVSRHSVGHQRRSGPRMGDWAHRCARCVVQCGAVWCSVVQCLAVCCRVLPCVAVCCRVLQCVAVCYSVVQWVAAMRGVAAPTT